MTSPHLRQFAYQDKFKMSFDNVLIFAGHFINSSGNNLLGKNLYIPVTQNHPALTFTLSRMTWAGIENLSSLIISFNSPEEREVVYGYDFVNDIFYVDS